MFPRLPDNLLCKTSAAAIQQELLQTAPEPLTVAPIAPSPSENYASKSPTGFSRQH